jgi:hypothetical protein
VDIFKPIQDYIEFRKTIPELKVWCKENNLDERKTIHEIWKMFLYKSIIARMVSNLTKNGTDNCAVVLLSTLLCGVNTITENENPEYSWRALDEITQIYRDMINETGTPSEQFELMVKSATQ